MSKAKELARAMLDMATDMRYKGHATIEFFDKVEELIDAVLSEPEPELRGWIEVHNKDGVALLVNLRHLESVGLSSYGGTMLEMNRDDCVFTVKESYDEIKQLIKGAS